MISGVKIPVTCPFKFYAADVDFDNGVNFINVDNQRYSDQGWAGVYEKFFAQAVPLYWHDLTYSIDFQISATNAVYSNINAYLIDEDGTELETLTKESYYNYDPPSGDRQLRFYLESASGLSETDYYRLKISDASNDLFISERLQFSEKNDYNFPLSYTNFENDFGLIFDNDSDPTWYGKMMVPMRMFEPDSLEERETYKDDSGGIVTLRAVPQRAYKFETLPIPLWFGEKLRLIFACSDLELNKLSVNVEEAPSIERISETDLCVVSCTVILDNFDQEYWQEEQVNTVTEKLSEWDTQEGWAGSVSFDGKDIVSIINSGQINQGLEQDVIIVEDKKYVIVIDYQYLSAGIQSADMSLVFDGNAYDVSIGKNVIIVAASESTTDTVELRLTNTILTYGKVYPSIKTI